MTKDADSEDENFVNEDSEEQEMQNEATETTGSNEENEVSEEEEVIKKKPVVSRKRKGNTIKSRKRKVKKQKPKAVAESEEEEEEEEEKEEEEEEEDEATESPNVGKEEIAPLAHVAQLGQSLSVGTVPSKPSLFDRGIKLRGRKLKSNVNGKVRRGEVADYDRRNRYYKIRFEDGAEEKMLWRSVEPMLVPWEELAAFHANGEEIKMSAPNRPPEVKKINSKSRKSR